MGMRVEVVLPKIDVQFAAAVNRGLLNAGKVVLAEAVAGAPREPVARHSVHLAETGFVSMAGEDRVVIGFEAFWALWQELNTDYHHETGHAKFLELALAQSGTLALEEVAAEIVRSFA